MDSYKQQEVNKCEFVHNLGINSNNGHSNQQYSLNYNTSGQQRQYEPPKVFRNEFHPNTAVYSNQNFYQPYNGQQYFPYNTTSTSLTQQQRQTVNCLTRDVNRDIVQDMPLSTQGGGSRNFMYYNDPHYQNTMYTNYGGGQYHPPNNNEFPSVPSMDNSFHLNEQVALTIQPNQPDNRISQQGGRKVRAPRKVYTQEQLEVLNKIFARSPYIDLETRSVLATTIGVSQLQVKVWFQNKRSATKKLHKGKTNESEQFNDGNGTQHPQTEDDCIL